MLLIKNANLISMEDVNYEIKDILIKDGKIIGIGSYNPEDYSEYRVIDACGRYVTPGLVDPHCHVGMIESTIGWAGSDCNEMSNPITPELRAIDGIKPHDECFKEALESGVTTVCTGPGSANVIGGTFCALKTKGATVEEMVLVEELCMKMALGENPKRVYGNSKTSPQTRMASAALMREWLMKAKKYHEKKVQYQQDLAEGKEAKEVEFNMKLDALSKVFEGLPVKIHAHQADDIATAMRIAKEFGIKMTVDHATEGYLIADTLKQNNQPVIIGPTLGNKSKYELKAKSFDSGKVLYNAGVEFAIMTDHPVIEQKHTLVQLALFVKAGLPELAALKAVTINAAKLCGIDNRVGSIKEGKDADIVIWSGHPLDIMTEASVVILNGKVEKN
jgi:imidazolonepropionase-like amidohydrolase